MTPVVVEPVRGYFQRRKFLRFPFELYRGSPHWVPPLLLMQRELLGWSWRKHPFYDEAESQSFLAHRDGKVVGRITAILNRAHNRVHKEERGFFGFFESIDDTEVSRGLFDAAARWLAERGITDIRGPVSPSMNYECGLLIEGFDQNPTFLTPYNLPYYARLVEDAGFHKAHDLLGYTGYASQLEEMADSKVRRVTDMAKERFGITVESLDTRRFGQEVELFLELYNYSLEQQWGFVPLGKREVRHFASSLKHLIEPKLALKAIIDGRSVGVVLALPDYNPRIKKMGGRLFPFGFLTLLKKPRPLHTVRVLAINVVPQYVGWGVGLVLLAGLVPKVLEAGVKVGDFTWVSETNDVARGGLEKGGVALKRRFRIYDRA